MPSSAWQTTTILSLVVTVCCTSFLAPAAGQPSSSSYNNCIDRPISSGSLSLNICTQETHFRFGETVTFVAILTNNGPAPIYSAPASSVTVQDRLGHTVFLSATLLVCIAIQNCTIKPGQTMTITIPWQTNSQFFQAIISGPYTVSAKCKILSATGADNPVLRGC